MMQHLMILKIETLCCETVMECDLLSYYVEDFPHKITLFGEAFMKTGWSSDRKIVYYKARH